MRLRSVGKWTLGSALLLFLVPCSVRPMLSEQAAPQQTTVPHDDAKDFQDRVAKYLVIQKKAVGSVPSVPKKQTDPARIVKHEQEVADAIRALRPKAMPGEIFTPWLRRVISTAVKQQVQGKAGADAKATILGEGNPKSPESPAPAKLTINGTYPDKAPLSSVPPSVLMALPVLPKEIEYRFVGHSLILRDTKANIVVDILPDAF